MMIGFTLALTAIRGNAANDSSLAFLFAGDAAGFLADGFAPPPFTPDLLFGPDTAGFYADGYAPPAFDLTQLFGIDTPGFYAGGYEASP